MFLLKVRIDAFFKVFSFTDIEQGAKVIEKPIDPGLLAQGFELFVQDVVPGLGHGTKIVYRKKESGWLGKQVQGWQRGIGCNKFLGKRVRDDCGPNLCSVAAISI